MSENTERLLEAGCYYDLDKYLFSQVTRRFKQGNEFSAFDFYAIITWKANRAKTNVRKGLAERNISPAELMGSVRTISDREKLQTLVAVPGIGVPIASAILTVCYPKRFTVLDYRAWETLYELKRVPSNRIPSGVDGYFTKYLPVCRRLADDMKISLRKLDLVLWGWSQKKSIEELTAI